MSYRGLLRSPCVIRLLAGSRIGRLPFAMAVGTLNVCGPGSPGGARETA